MIPREVIEIAPMPDGGDPLRLVRRGTEYSIMLGAVELMNSRLSGSEEALGTLACERIVARPRPHLLIGGLGMGFTLRAVLAKVGDDARITVAELVPAVVAWGRGPMAHLFAGSLDDPRVQVAEADVGDLIASACAGYDAILLDVDNGPDGLSRAGNDRLYDRAGLTAAAKALRPGGVLAIWSAAPDPAFTRRLCSAGFVADEIPVRARDGRGARHWIWIAARPA